MCYVKQLDMPTSGFSSVMHATPRSNLSREIEKYGKPEIVPFDPTTVNAQILAAGHKRIAPKIITAGDLSHKKKAVERNDGTIDTNTARIAAAAVNLSMKVQPQMPIPIHARPLTSPNIVSPQNHHHSAFQVPSVATPTALRVYSPSQPMELVKVDSNGTLDLSMKSSMSPEKSMATATPVMTTAPSLVQLSVPQPLVQNPVSTLATPSPVVQTPTILQIPRNYEQAVDYTKVKSTSSSGTISAINLTSPIMAAAINLTIPTAIPTSSLNQVMFGSNMSQTSPMQLTSPPPQAMVSPPQMYQTIPNTPQDENR